MYNMYNIYIILHSISIDCAGPKSSVAFSFLFSRCLSLARGSTSCRSSTSAELSFSLSLSLRLPLFLSLSLARGSACCKSATSAKI